MNASNNFELNNIVAKHVSQPSSQRLINPFFDMTGQPSLNPPSYFYQDPGYSNTGAIDWMDDFTVSTETAGSETDILSTNNNTDFDTWGTQSALTADLIAAHNLSTSTNKQQPLIAQPEDGTTVHATAISLHCDVSELPEKPVDRRSLASIVKKNSLALVGAVIYQIQKTRSNGKPYFVNKYTLPDTTGPPRYDANEQLLFRPEWILSARYNRDFIDAVVDAVGKVRAEDDGIIRTATLTYFKQMRTNYTAQVNSSVLPGNKENLEKMQLQRLRDAKFQAKLAGY